MKEKTKFGKEKYNNLGKNRKIVTYKRRFNEAYFSCCKQFNFPREKKRERGYRSNLILN